MIPDKDHLLPLLETPLNKALAAVSTRLEDLNAPTREVYDPWTCPPQFLKALAHAFSVDLWYDDWPETRKRSIIANSIKMQRLKGTERGTRLYLRYSPGRLVSYIKPPQGVYSGPSLTREQREAWLSGLPQIRVWRSFERGTRGTRLFIGGQRFKSFFACGFTQPSNARDLLRRRARYVVNGQETDTRVSEFGSYYRLHLKGAEGSRVISGRPFGGRFYRPNDALKFILTVQPEFTQPWRAPVWPRLTPVSSEPELVKERGQFKYGTFSGRYVREGYFRRNMAWRYIYYRHAISDGRGINRRPAIQYMGVGRYSFPRHTAYLRVSAPGRRSRFAAGAGIVAPRSRYWIPHDGENMRRTLEAIRASKRVTDRLMVYTGWVPRITADAEPFYADQDEFIVGRPTAEQVYGKNSKVS